MQISLALLLALSGAASAAVAGREYVMPAQPAARIVRQELEASATIAPDITATLSPEISATPSLDASTSTLPDPPIPTSFDASTTSTTLDPTISDPPTVNEGDLLVNKCIPKSICVDKINSCGKRYGACYDKNSCGGKTASWSVPPCSTTTTKESLPTGWWSRF